MTDVKLLKEKIELSGLKISYIASELGLSRTATYNKINGKTLFTQYEIDVLCKLLPIRSLSEKESIFFAK